MKQILKFSILLLFFMPLQKVAGQDIIMGSQPLVSIDETVRKFYDPGGLNSPYDTDLHVTMTLQSEESEKCLYIWFEVFILGNHDTLWIYDGPDVSAPLKGAYSLVNLPSEIISSSNTLTFVFQSDTVPLEGMNLGWKAQVCQYDTNAQVVLYGEDPYVTTTNAIFCDVGGIAAPIGSNSPSGTWQQFTVPLQGQHIKCEFTQFQVNGLMKVYDGQYNDPNKRLIGQFCTSTLDASTNNMPPALISTNKTLTFVYESVASDAGKPGWVAKISNVAELYVRDPNDISSPPCATMTNETFNSIAGIDIPGNEYYNNHINGEVIYDSLEASKIGIYIADGDSVVANEYNYHFDHPTLILNSKREGFVGKFANDYTVSQILYDESSMMFGYDEGEPIQWPAYLSESQRDDRWLAHVDLPFPFVFFGQTYTTVYPSSNGLISFDPQTEWGSCSWSTSVPQASPTLNGSTYSYTSTPYNYYNSAYLVYEDINPNENCTPDGQNKVKYGVLGTEPCRAFVFNYNGINLYSCCSSTGPNTYQMVMYEGSNVIDVYIKRRNFCSSWNGGRGVVGLQNKKGSQRVIAPGRDFTSTWTVNVNSISNGGEAWRFTPITESGSTRGKRYWYIDTVDWTPAKAGLVPDTTGVHFRRIDTTENEIPYAVFFPEDTALYICVYEYQDASGKTRFSYSASKVNVNIPKIRVVSDKKTYCPNDTMFLEVDSVLSADIDTSNIISCKWWSKKHPRPLGTSTTRKNEVLASYIPPGTYDTIYVEVTFENKAKRTDSVIVFVLNPISPTITSRNFVTKEDYICKGDTLTLLATHPKTDQFEWNTGETSRSIEVHPLNDALYIVTTKNDCQVSDTFKVVVLPLPPTFFTPDPVDIIMDNGIGTVTCTTPLSQGGYQLTWNFDDPNSPDNIVQGPDVVTHGYTRPRDYTITLTAVDANNCDSTYTDRVSVKVPDLFYVPSAFSPNNDEHNQKFRPSGQIVDPDRPYSMEIFNRYGMLVFSTNSPYDYWDGRNKKGELCPEGVYVYMISFYHINEHDNPDALPAVRKGTVTLLR